MVASFFSGMNFSEGNVGWFLMWTVLAVIFLAVNVLIDK